ncbi:hypothetical protein [Actibacterium mucosum]|uniref:hypothetical protein n=1 Tax=Actibacterium mucosum TaxID=1087332 RepID=UPI001F2B187B|nr:hypothetical protein [Actibacterium mucosum]
MSTEIGTPVAAAALRATMSQISDGSDTAHAGCAEETANKMPDNAHFRRLKKPAILASLTLNSLQSD